MNNKPKIIVAFDFSILNKARSVLDELDPAFCCIKIGKEMFSYFGPAWVKEVINKGFAVFLDLKFHDIPTTVAKACVACAELGVFMLNVHAQGGPQMMTTAARALINYPETKLIAVTVLTSFDEKELKAVGINNTLEAQVTHLAKLAQDCGLAGVVASAQEASLLRTCCGNTFTLVTPGIRLKKDNNNDQKRVMTPSEAIRAGADFLVVGRPITEGNSPKIALQQMVLDISK